MSIFPKLKVYIQVVNKGCYPYINPTGDLVDLRAGEDVDLLCPQAMVQHQRNNQLVRDVEVYNKRVSLGIRVLMPHGMKADVDARSGTYDKFHVFQANGEGKIDRPYNGPEDIWKANLVALQDCHINGPHPATEQDYLDENDPNIPEKKRPTIIDGYVQGDRICQFEVHLSQFATFRDKLRWFFSSGIEFVIVDNIDTVTNRGGFGKSDVR